MNGYPGFGQNGAAATIEQSIVIRAPSGPREKCETMSDRHKSPLRFCIGRFSLRARFSREKGISVYTGAAENFPSRVSVNAQIIDEYTRRAPGEVLRLAQEKEMELEMWN